jgi:hypothetical protein
MIGSMMGPMLGVCIVGNHDENDIFYMCNAQKSPH